MDPNAETAGGGGGSGRMPDRVGPYRILAIIGEGGFGVVYEAEQTEPVRRRVALKVIKPGMDSSAVVARFEAERQALAVMDHPCIAKVFDGGITAPEHGSRPYFVMELVKGEPITEFCDTHTLSIDERVGLFIRVCAAVQHAHAKGVIHRDLKPSNVLVGYDGDGVAQPKVIDFGVAKALNQRLTERTVFTERGQLIGTPEYMSPEQAEMSGLDIDTRSDVYSLGVLLYELLAGVLPFEPRTLRAAAFHEVQRIIREVDPPRPSARLGTLLSAADDTGSRIVRARLTDGRALSSVLRRDLDWVVMKCLEKDRERRYATAMALGEDLRRYLTHEPVEAGPPGVVYGVQKFVRRHRPTLAVAGVVFAALSSATVISVLAAGRAERARAAEASRSAQLERVSGYQGALLGDLGAARMGNVLREALLVEAADAESRAGASAADVEAARRRVGEVLERLDMPAVAAATLDRAMLKRAEQRAREALATDPAVLATVLEGLAGGHWALGERDKGLALAREVLDLRFGSLGRAHTATIGAQARVALYLRVMGRIGESEPYASDAYAIAVEHLDPDDPNRLSATHVLGMARARRGEEGGEALLAEAMEGRRRALGPGHADTVWSMLALVEICQGQERYDRAGPLVREAVESAVRFLGDDEEVTLYAKRYLRRQLEREGDLDAAIELVRDIVRTRDRAFGATHPGSISELRALIRLLLARGDAAEARLLADELVVRSGQAFGETDRRTIDARAMLAQASLAGGDPGSATEAQAPPSAALP